MEIPGGSISNHLTILINSHGQKDQRSCLLVSLIKEGVRKKIGRRDRNRKCDWDFLGGPGVKNPSSNAEDIGSIPGQGTKIPYATVQLNPQPLEPEHYNQRAQVPQ